MYILARNFLSHSSKQFIGTERLSSEVIIEWNQRDQILRAKMYTNLSYRTHLVTQWNKQFLKLVTLKRL